MSTKKKYYAYHLPDGEQSVVTHWSACEKKVSGVAGARYRGFNERAEAVSWLADGARYEEKPKLPRPKHQPGVYFDAGTGRGHGVEVSVTDEMGRDLLALVLPKNRLNKFGKERLAGGITNNYGELLACKYALAIAEKIRVKIIFGDSRLVLDYWSKGVMRAKDLPPKTVALAKEVTAARKAFEAEGGHVKHVPGAYNPADLGFH
ncbi:MAG TPA: viroplasmin family protein [Candidatus Paceibacterota bacterium]|nr:viroplasmin family protein [Candidatus Paceibacterota bacterium]